MTLAATYDIPESGLTRDIDAAVPDWSVHVDGSAQFRIRIAYDDKMSFLASRRSITSVRRVGEVTGEPFDKDRPALRPAKSVH